MKKIRNHEYQIRGCLSRPRKSQFYQAVMTLYEDDIKIDRKSKTTKCSDRTDATLVMGQMINNWYYELKLPQSMSLVALMEEWFSQLKREATTLNGYRTNLDKYIRPYFGPDNLAVRDVGVQELREFKEHLNDEGDLTGQSINKILSNIRCAFDYGMEKGIVEMNPARAVKSMEAVPYEAQTLTIDELIKLWGAVKNTIIEPSVFLTSLYGFRRGEICGLKWEKINLDADRFRIDETRTRAKTEITKKPKNRSSDRTMPLLGIAKQYLIALQEKQKRAAFLCGKDFWANSGYIVVDEIGRQISISRHDKFYKAALKKAGLPDVRFHDLRHTVATYLLEIGVPIEEVSAWLGHSDIATTTRVYAHVNIGIRKNTARKIDEYFGYNENSQENKKISIDLVLKQLFETA